MASGGGDDELGPPVGDVRLALQVTEVLRSFTSSEVAARLTHVGRLHLEAIGAGPAAVLWPSLLVDSRSWHRVVDELGRDRRLVMITGPGR